MNLHSQRRINGSDEKDQHKISNPILYLKPNPCTENNTQSPTHPPPPKPNTQPKSQPKHLAIRSLVFHPLALYTPPST